MLGLVVQGNKDIIGDYLENETFSNESRATSKLQKDIAKLQC